MSGPSSPSPGKPRLGVDSMLFVYCFEEHPTHLEAARAIFRAAEEGRCELVASVIARLEVLVAPRRDGDEALCGRYRRIFQHFPHLSVLAVDDDVVERAAELRAVHGLKTPDAIHLATAQLAGVRAFITEDDALLRAGGKGALRIAEALALLPRAAPAPSRRRAR